jgi:type IV pilus assembly protein PilX
MTKLFKQRSLAANSFFFAPQKGASLIMVLIILTIVSMLGIAGIQISMLGERGARNDRDMQIAWQAAEAALIDAEFDIFGPGASTRRAEFQPTNRYAFIEGCGTSGNNTGLCSLAAIGSKPAWLTADFTDTSTKAPTTALGTYTGRTFASGAVGVQPSKAPRYVIEPIPDPADPDLSSNPPLYVYRVTAMGFGPRDEIQAVIQMIYRY